MDKKKVLLVITKSNWGGAQRYVFDLATHLPKDQYETVVAFGGTGTKGAETGLLAQKLREAGVCTIFIKSFIRDVSAAKEFSALGELVQIFKTERPDIVHVNSSKAGGLGALAARLAGVPKVIFTVHGLPWDEPRNILSRTLIYITTRLTFLLSDKVITISKDNYNRARACWLCRNKIVLIYNGIDTHMPLSDGGVIRKEFPPNVKITGTVGELTKNKNQIALLKKARKDASMYVALVGEGEDRAMLERVIFEYGLKTRVKLFGFMPASDVLRGFDTFALPSLKEGLPYVLLEAKAAGLPIEANLVGGIPEILAGKIEDFTLERMVRETENLYKK